MLGLGARAIETRTRNQSDFARLRMIRGDAHATVSYDVGEIQVRGGVVLMLYLHDAPLLTLDLPAGATGEHRATSSPMPLRRGANVLRLVTSVYGPPRPTRAALHIVTSDGAVLNCTFETPEDVSNIDQTWKIVKA
jgi:hypothetical protein